MEICRKTSKRCFVFALCIVTSFMFMPGCENKKEMSDPKASLERLAEDYWNKRLLDRDYKATYSMELEKGSLPFEKYLKRVHNAGQIQYLSIKTKEVKIDRDKGSVELIVRCIIAPVPKELEMSLGDRWVLKSNRWKHILPKPKE